MKWILHAVIGLLGYYVIGQFGLMLAIPPGFASSIWPAAGFGMAAAMLLNRFATTLGIALGSFFLNLTVAVPDLSGVTLASTYVPASIALGTYLQVQLLVSLYRKCIGPRLLPDRIRDVSLLMLVVAPLGCLFSATFGAGTLLLFQVIPEQALLFTWFTWWTGDTIGVLLFAPLTLAAFSPRDTLSIGKKAQVILPVLVVFSLILMLFFTSIQSRQQLNHQESERRANAVFDDIEKRFDLAVSRLQAFEAFMQSSENVTDSEFKLFSSTVLQGETSIKAVGWTPIVLHPQRPRVEAEMRQIESQPFGFTEISRDGRLESAGQRDLYYPVLHLYPFEGNERAYGLDLGFNPSRLSALEKARESGLAVATAPIKLVQETEDKSAFILYLPVTRSQGAHKASEVYGFVSGVFRVESMLEDLLVQARAQGLTISIMDLSVLQGRNWLLAPPESRPGELVSQSRTLNVGTRSYEVSLFATDPDYLGKDWNSWWVMTAGIMFAILLQSLILIITGNVAAVEKLVADKTKKLEQALLAADRANVAKSNFLSNISHELRTPLNAIINLIRMSARARPGQPLESYLYKADLASETLMSLINHTLDFNKIESGKIELETTAFDFIRVIEKIYVLFSAKAEEKGIGLELDLPEHLPEKLLGDPLRLEQVLSNICANAVKFTEQGKVTITMDIGEHSSTRIHLVIAVRDTGIGIPTDSQAVLFQPFQQADGSTTRRFGGSGLGLSISKRLVELMQGSITLESREGAGSVFTLNIPFGLSEQANFLDRKNCLARIERDAYSGDSTAQAMSPSEQEVADKRDSEMEQEDATKALSGRHILVVEDVQMNQFIAQHMLETAGARVTIAANGQEAIELIATEPSIELVLMDIQMPVMDGYEATRRLRQEFDAETLPIVAMTANAMQPDIDRCLQTGMNDHIGKPIDESVMIRTILTYLKKA